MKTIGKYWNDIILQASGNSIAQIIGILGMPILTRLYTPEDFAVQTIFIQIVTFLAGFVSLRYEYFIPLTKSKNESMTIMKFICLHGMKAVSLSLLTMYVLERAGALDFVRSNNVYIFYVAPIAAYAISISLLFQHEAQRQNNFSESAKSEINGKLFYILSGIALSIFKSNIGLVLTTPFGAIGKIFYLKKYVRTFLSDFRKERIEKEIVRRYKGRSAGLVVSNMILITAGAAPVFFIERKFDTEALGNFSLVMATIFLPSGLLGAAIGTVFFQRAAAFANMHEYDEIFVLWRETLKKSIFIGLPVYSAIFLMSPYLYPLVFGHNWSQAGRFAEAMALAAFLSFIAGPLDKLSLVFSIGYYLPLIHIFRLISILLAMFLALKFKLNVYYFVFFLSCALALSYLLDLIICRMLVTMKIKVLHEN